MSDDEPKVMRALPGGGVEVDFDALDTVYGEHLAKHGDPTWAPPSLAAPAGEWLTQDGRVLAIAEMATRHLRNAVALFAKFGYGDHPKVGELRIELTRRETVGMLEKRESE
jgi:hypothetical protein